MSNLAAMQEKISALGKSANHLLAKKGNQPWNKMEQDEFDAYINGIERAKAQVKAIERGRELEADEFFNSALNKPKKEDGVITPRDAVALYLRHGSRVTQEQAIAISNAMSTTTAAEGGYTVPTEVSKQVIDALKAYGGMREAATILSTDSGAPMSYPTSDGTAEVGEIVAENIVTSNLDITFGTVSLNPFKYSSKQIALPIELIQDSGIDVVAFVINRLATRIARIQNAHFTIGTGAGQPKGIVPAAASGKVGIAGEVVTVIYDDLFDLKHSVNRAYRRSGSWMMADLTVASVSKIKETTGRPIWEPSTQANAPNRLLGFPVIINDDMPVMAAGAKSILFGDLSQYIIRDVANSTTMRRFDDSAFALKGQVGFCGWQRSGGNLMDVAAVKLYVNAAV